MKFEWDINKAAVNIKIHGVSFEEAEDVFFDDFALDVYDESHSSFAEDRFNILGLTRTKVLLVVYTVRSQGVYRIISARQATRSEASSYWNERRKYE